MRNKHNGPEGFLKKQILSLSPLSITMLYMAFGFLWIAYSDLLLESMIDDIAVLSQFQTYKGWFYVLLTSLFAFLIIRKFREELTKSNRLIKKDAAYYQRLFRNNPLPVFLVDPSSLHIRDGNQAAEVITEYDLDDLIGKPIDSLCRDEESKGKLYQLWQSASPYFIVREIHCETKSGNHLTVNLYCSRDELSGVNNPEQPYMVMVQDVTNEVETRDELKKLVREMRQHIANTPLGVLQWDQELRITFMNQMAEEIFEIKFEDAKGKTALELGIIHSEDTDDVKNQVIEMIHQNKSGFTGRNRNVTASGRVITCDWYNTIFDDPQSNSYVLQSLVNDVTKQVEYKEKLEQVNAHLEELVAARTRSLQSLNEELESFSYSVSHDLRAPLRAIRGFTEATLEENDADEQKKLLQKVLGSCNKMNHQIDNYLRLSHISRKELVLEDVDLTEMAREILERETQRFSDRNISFEVEENMQIRCDRMLMEATLENLISNAVKFTSNEATACIRMYKTAEDSFAIQDNGVGFDMRHAGKLFKPFSRLHSEHDFKGTGIGLASVKRILNKHGAHIEITGEPSEGTRVLITMPSKDIG